MKKSQIGSGAPAAASKLRAALFAAATGACGPNIRTGILTKDFGWPSVVDLGDTHSSRP